MLLEDSAKGASAHHRSAPWLLMSLLTAVALFLAGCTPDAQGEAEPTVEASVGASDSTPGEGQKLPGDSGPPTPKPESHGDDLTAAKHTAEYFLDLYGYTVQSGDTELIRELSLEGCGFCESAIKWTEKTYSSGKHQVGGDIKYKGGRISTDADLGPQQVQVVFEADQAKADVYDSSGSVVESSPKTSYWMGVNLEFIDTQWRIISVSGVSK